MEFQGNIIKKTWEYGKKLSFGPDFVTFGPIIDPQKIFQKNLAQSVARYNGQLSSCTISEKN